MTRISLITTAMLVATGSAFAGSDHYGSDNANHPAALVANVDNAFVASVRRPAMGRHDGVDTRMMTGPGITEAWPVEPGQGIWGN
ncbi:DUF680 domain-containing protein [Mesorhizobium sp. M00.F.Ca.ET.216.01.1.1]|uniref:DUF680 domain-containing protein n=1 Tax=Mesorhizobium sp. M00.F.Ca.ET.216.01.1.1 TaxID=2500528 RepID=UPI000FDBF693|nr:DUF680 domain-containing protein [Mesorhizobium sp. M00.F.Ca.ET.216.01.1.1]TGQ46619.1 DUF680 domain-containing protein [Mesorhizobium sp. M00.F.Ca.ET.216.01.1.1]